MKLKKPSELFEQRRLEALAKESVQNQKESNKRIVSPKELFGEIVEDIVEEKIEEVTQEPVDPYIQEIDSLKLQLEEFSNSIPEEIDLTEVFETIESLKERINNLPKQKSYDGEIESIREELVKIEESIPVVEKFDPSDLYENIVFIKTRLEEVRSEIPTIPEPILYDDELNELKELIENVRRNIPVIPEIKYYDEELQGILNLIEDVKNQIPELPEIKYYDDEISVIENRLIEIQNSIPVVPEIKYYDEDVNDLKEQIKSVKNSIPTVPKIKYYDKDIKDLKEEITSVKELIPVVPEVKYYDEEVKDLYKKVSEIKIPDQDEYLKEVKSIYSIFEKKNHKLLEKIKYLEEVFEKFNEETLTEGLLNIPPDVKNSDPLTPLNQNYATLEDLQNHYKIFINRIQQQLSTLGGGGETRLEFLDDIDRSSAKINGRYLKYNAATGKWIGALGGGGGGSQTLDDTLQLGNDSTIGMSVGVVTATKFVGDGSLLTNLPNGGYANVAGIATYASTAGIATYATSSGIATIAQGLTGTPNLNVGVITASKYYGDGSSLTGIVATGSGIVIENNGSVVGTATTIDFSTNLAVTFSSGIATVAVINGGSNSGYANTAGIATYASTAGIATYASTAGIATNATYATSSGIATYASTAGIATYATSAGIATYASTSGIATYATTAGIATYATSSGIATYASTAGIATNATYATSSGIATIAGYTSTAGIATYATTSGVSTYATTSGVSTYSSTAGIATYATTAGIATYATSSGIATYASTAGIATNATYAISSGIATIAGYASTAGISTYATTSGVSTYATTSGISTVAQNLTGSPNITVSSVNSSGVVTASSFTGSGTNLTSLNASNLSSGTVPSARITASFGDFTVGNNLYVTGALSVGGTSVILNAAQLQINDKDIVVGYTTDSNNNDVSNDNTANHGGISVASTVGSPIINIPLQVGVNSNPSTYKQLMWIKQGNYSGMGTDAWVFNYAVSIGNTATVQNGSRLTVGSGFTVFDTYLDAQDIKARNINASGIITASSFSGNASSATIAGYASTAGIATYATSSGIATYATSSGIATYATTAGIATYATTAGIATYATSAGIATYATNAGVSTTVIGGIASVTQLSVSGISTFTNGPVLIGSGTSTGTASQPLQVTGGAYVSGNLGIGTTNPTSKLTVQGDVLVSGVVTATSINATHFGSGTNLTGIVTSIVAGTNVTVSGSTGQVTINSSGGGTPTYGGYQPVDLLEVMLFS